MMENKIILRKDLDRSLTHEELDGNFEVVNSINETIEKTGISQFQTIKEILPKVDTNWSFRYTSGSSTLEFVEGDEKFMSQWGQSIASVNFSKDKKSLIGLLTGGNGTGVIMGTINEGNKLQVELIADEDDHNWHNNMILPKEGVAAFDSSDDLSVNIIGFPEDSAVLITDNKGANKQVLEVDIDDFGLNGIVSNDGTTIFIGSEDNLYIFKINNDKFELFQTIEDIETKDNNNYISRALDTNKDGSTFIVGLPNENEVRIYELENNKYVLKSNIAAPTDSEYFGWDISISDNFNTLVISDMYFENTETHEYDGIVYVYTKDDAGVWNKSQEINSSNQLDGDEDNYGALVELSEDAKLLIISAAKDETNSWIEAYELKEKYELIGKKQLDEKIDKIMILNNTQFAVTNIINGMTPRTTFINTVGSDIIALNNHSIITDNLLPTPIKPLVSLDNNGYILIDRNNKASNGAIAFGNSCTASGSSSFATGYRSSSKGKYSCATGYKTTANTTYGMVLGKYNKGLSNNLFEIGYGTSSSSSNRKNVFEVSTSGTAKLNDAEVITTKNIVNFLPEDDSFNPTKGLGISIDSDKTTLQSTYNVTYNDNYFITAYKGTVTVYDIKYNKLFDFKDEDESINFGKQLNINSNNRLVISNYRTDITDTDNGSVYIYDITNKEATLIKQINGTEKQNWLGKYRLLITDDNMVFSSICKSGYSSTVYTLVYDIEADKTTIINVTQHMLDKINTTDKLIYAYHHVYIKIINYETNKVVLSKHIPDVNISSITANALTVTKNYFIAGYPLFDVDAKDDGVIIIMDYNGNEIKRFNNPNAYNTAKDDQFGYERIFANEDETLLIAQANGEDSSSSSNVGTIYIFEIATGNLLKTITPDTINTDTIRLLAFKDNKVFVKDGTSTITIINLEIYNKTVMMQRNKIPYNVETDYQPAHKMYVDDAITTAITPLYGKTDERPEKSAIGTMYFDTDLNKPIWFNGTKWVLATGEDASEK